MDDLIWVYWDFLGPNAVGGDAIATKVVELSKKNRELSSELESERAKLKKLSIKCKELESMVNKKRNSLWWIVLFLLE